MSLNMKDLSAEERAIVDRCTFEFWLSEPRPRERYYLAMQQCEEVILARRALFAPAQPEPKRAEMPCPNCKEPIKVSTEHILFMHEIPYPRYTCPPAPSPAPVAGELAEAVRNAAALLRSFGNSKPLMQTAANALEAWARSQAQQHRFEIKTLEAKYDNERVLRERDARSQAQPVARDLPKVRGYFDSLANLPQYQNAEGMEFIAEIRAELDAQPKAVPVAAIKRYVTGEAQLADQDAVERWLAQVEGE